MSIQTIYFAPLAISRIISANLAFYTWRHSQTPGAKPIFILMVALFQWKDQPLDSIFKDLLCLWHGP